MVASWGLFDMLQSVHYGRYGRQLSKHCCRCDLAEHACMHSHKYMHAWTVLYKIHAYECVAYCAKHPTWYIRSWDGVHVRHMQYKRYNLIRIYVCGCAYLGEGCRYAWWCESSSLHALCIPKCVMPSYMPLIRASKWSCDEYIYQQSWHKVLKGAIVVDHCYSRLM